MSEAVQNWLEICAKYKKVNFSRQFLLKTILVLSLFLLSFLSAIQLLFLDGIPSTPNEDLARHVALALNFSDALKEGQLIPRLQSLTGITHGIIQDVPVYQYYGFLSSLLAQPGLFLGLSPLSALIFGVIIIRWIGALAIFTTCRVLKLSWQAGVVAVVAWLSFPYIQSNLYGRAAIPEAVAQAVIAILPLSWALAARGATRIAIASITVTEILLALAHPIFFMWGSATYVLMIISCIFQKKYNIVVACTIGLAIGIFISSFQWLPALLSAPDLQINFLSLSPFDRANLTSYSGLFGWPVPFLEGDWVYYFTVSMWLVPVICCSLIYSRRYIYSRIDIYAYLFLLAFFFVLSYSPVDIWRIMPKQTWATQFPYRLLSFVAVFSAVLLSFSYDLIGSRWGGMLPISCLLIVFISGPSLIAPKARTTVIATSVNVKSIYASLDYVVTNKSSFMAGGDWLLKNNLIVVPEHQDDRFLYLEARSGMPSGIGISLKVIDADSKDNLSRNDLFISAEGISERILIPHDVRAISLIPSATFRPSDISASSDTRELSILISNLAIARVDTKFIKGSEVERKITTPYSRSFSFKKQDFGSQSTFVVKLPMAYSRFWKVSQGGHQLSLSPGYSGTGWVTVNDTTDQIVAVYTLPVSIYIFTIAGLIIALVVLFVPDLLLSRRFCA